MAVSSDVQYPVVPYPLGVAIGNYGGYGASSLTFFGFWGLPAFTYKPSVGCAPPSVTLASVRKPAVALGGPRTLVRTVRIYPRAVHRVVLACSPGERVVSAGSAFVFLTHLPPSSRLIRRLRYHGRRVGSTYRVIVVAPAGVGANGRIELRVTVLCGRARTSAPTNLQATSSVACRDWTPCQQVVGPWVTFPANEGNTYDLSCPAGKEAVGADALTQPYGNTAGVVTGGGYVPGLAHGMEFGAYPYAGVTIQYQPIVGCSPPGATSSSSALRSSGASPGYHRLVRKIRLHPRAIARVRLACARGERLLHGSWAVAFYTSRPPSPRLVKRLLRRKRRTRSAFTVVVAAPVGLGVHERVELQITVLCAPVAKAPS